MAESADPYGFKEEGRDLLRGLAGGILFGMPILYTMEVWHHGMSYDSSHLLGTLVLTFFLNVIFSFFAGVRKKYSSESLIGSLEDGLTSLGIGFLLSIVILWLIGRLHPLEDLKATVGKVLLEACIISVGVTFTNFKFKSSSNARNGENKSPNRDESFRQMSSEEKQLKVDLDDLVVTFAGAFVFAFNVAPTEEIVLIASSMNSMSILILLGAELFFCYLLLYAAGFKEHEVYEKDSIFQSSFAETMMTVASALLVSSALLALIGESSASSNSLTFISCVVTLGLPATVGGAAGRLII